MLDDPARWEALVSAIEKISAIEPERRDKYPSIPMADLADEAAFRDFTAAWDAVIDDVRRAEADRQ